MVDIKHEEYRRLQSELEPVSGMQEVVKELSERGVPLAVVSGSDFEFVATLLARHYHGYFKAIISGSDVSKGKPSAEPYVAGIRALGLNEVRYGATAIAIENSPMGVQSAVASGLTCYAFLINSPIPPADLHNLGAKEVVETVGALRTLLL
jgi:beta-phosphoglucomutase-like phosphatase (HAD superfamily)